MCSFTFIMFSCLNSTVVNAYEAVILTIFCIICKMMPMLLYIYDDCLQFFNIKAFSLVNHLSEDCMSCITCTFMVLYSLQCWLHNHVCFLIFSEMGLRTDAAAGVDHYGDEAFKYLGICYMCWLVFNFICMNLVKVLNF